MTLITREEQREEEEEKPRKEGANKVKKYRMIREGRALRSI